MKRKIKLCVLVCIVILFGATLANADAGGVCCGAALSLQIGTQSGKACGFIGLQGQFYYSSDVTTYTYYSSAVTNSVCTASDTTICGDQEYDCANLCVQGNALITTLNVTISKSVANCAETVTTTGTYVVAGQELATYDGFSWGADPGVDIEAGGAAEAIWEELQMMGAAVKSDSKADTEQDTTTTTTYPGCCTKTITVEVDKHVQEILSGQIDLQQTAWSNSDNATSVSSTGPACSAVSSIYSELHHFRADATRAKYCVNAVESPGPDCNMRASVWIYPTGNSNNGTTKTAKINPPGTVPSETVPKGYCIDGTLHAIGSK